MDQELGDFICPICGWDDFGSSDNKDGTFTRHCHGYLPEVLTGKNNPCLFHWSSKDDAQYLTNRGDP